MKFSRVTFTWGMLRTQPARWYLGLFGIYERESARFGLTDALIVSLRGALVWGFALALAGWLAAATVLSRVLAKRPHNTVTWSDCALLPVRWETVRMKRGQAYITEGLEDFRDNRWRAGATKLAAGLARHPATREGRRELASFYLAVRVRPRALATLLGGLDHGELDREYFDAVLSTALQGDDFDLALEACTRAEERWLSGGSGAEADRQWLRERRLVVLLRAGRSQEALRLVESWQLDTPVANEARVVALVELKRFAEAVAFLDDWEHRGGASVQTLQLRSQVLAAEGRGGELGRVLERLRAQQGELPATYIFATGKWLQAGDRAVAVKVFEDYRLRFGGDRRALEAMAVELVKHAEIELLVRSVEIAREHGYVARAVEMHLVDACIARGEWETARQVLERITARRTPDQPEQEQKAEALLDFLIQALASEVDGVQRAFVEFCRGQPLPLPLIKFMHSALMKAERYATARDLADFASLAYPGSAFLAEARETAAARVQDVSARIAYAQAEERAALAAAAERVRPEVNERMRSGGPVAPADEEAFFDALDAAQHAADWPRVVSLVTSVRPQRPAWLSRREGEIARAEIAARRRRGDSLELIAAVRSFLNGTAERNEEITTLARELAAVGNRSLGRTVLEEIVRKSPGFSEAADLLKAWTRAAELPDSGAVAEAKD